MKNQNERQTAVTETASPEASTISQNLTRSNSRTNQGELYARRITNLLDKARKARGIESELAGDELDKTLATWLEIIVFNAIPVDALNLCYLFAQKAAAKTLAETGREPWITANSLVAAWENGAKGEYAKKLNEHAKQLEASKDDLARDCPRCLSIGFERIYSRDGRYLGAKAGSKCDHRRLEPGEWLFDFHGGDPRDQATEVEPVEIDAEIAKLVDAGAIF